MKKKDILHPSLRRFARAMQASARTWFKVKTTEFDTLWRNQSLLNFQDDILEMIDLVREDIQEKKRKLELLEHFPEMYYEGQRDSCAATAKYIAFYWLVCDFEARFWERKARWLPDDDEKARLMRVRIGWSELLDGYHDLISFALAQGEMEEAEMAFANYLRLYNEMDLSGDRDQEIRHRIREIVQSLYRAGVDVSRYTGQAGTKGPYDPDKGG